LATICVGARAVAGSVTDADDLDRLFDTVKQKRGTLDILFANAETGALVPLSSNLKFKASGQKARWP